MIIHTLKSYFGQVIEIRELETGVWACPVCGFPISDAPPWWWLEPPREGGVSLKSWAVASFSSCRICLTQFGEDDYTECTDEDAVQKLWNELRQKWLTRVGRTQEARDQLRNLGIELPP